jgi:hypothetical protein
MQDRNGMQVPGTLLVAGDFNNGATLSIARSRLSDYGVADLKPGDLASADAQQRLLEGLTAQIATQAMLFRYEVLRSSFPEGGRFLDLEFTVALCRGEVIEGSRGRRRCVLS